jgi:hypothetical protein
METVAAFIIFEEIAARSYGKMKHQQQYSYLWVVVVMIMVL